MEEIKGICEKEGGPAVESRKKNDRNATGLVSENTTGHIALKGTTHLILSFFLNQASS